MVVGAPLLHSSYNNNSNTANTAAPSCNTTTSDKLNTSQQNRPIVILYDNNLRRKMHKDSFALIQKSLQSGPMAGKIQKAKEHRVYGKHCSYRRSDFYDLITL